MAVTKRKSDKIISSLQAFLAAACAVNLLHNTVSELCGVALYYQAPIKGGFPFIEIFFIIHSASVSLYNSQRRLLLTLLI